MLAHELLTLTGVMSPGLQSDTRGAVASEYLILVGCVALAMLGGFRTFGGAIVAKVLCQARAVVTLQAQDCGALQDTPDPTDVEIDEGPAPAPPEGASPDENAAYWASLSDAQRNEVIAQHPEWIGKLDGIPASARDAANRQILASEIERIKQRRDQLRTDLDNHILPDWLHPTNEDRELEIVEEHLASLGAIASILERETEDGHPRQLIMLDTSGEQVLAAVAIGDVDTATHVAVALEGTGTEVWAKPDVGNNLEGMDNKGKGVVEDGEVLLDQHGRGDETIAVVSWIGYDAPEGVTRAIDPRRANNGAPALEQFLDGIDASRTNDPHLTLLGHSYGSVVASEALQRGTGVDDAIFYGSPGLETSPFYVGHVTPDHLNVAPGHVYVIEAEGDHVADTGIFMGDPSFNPNLVGLSSSSTTITGADGQPRDLSASSGHSEYDVGGSTSQYNQSVIVAGLPQLVVQDK